MGKIRLFRMGAPKIAFVLLSFSVSLLFDRGTGNCFASGYEPLGPSSRRTGLTISEIHYHPPAREDGKDLQFIEIYNSQPIPQDVGGFRLSGGVDYLFPEGTVLAPLSFLVVAKDPAAIREVYSIENVAGPFSGELNNASDLIRLRNRTGAILLEVEYSDQEPWPVAADGTGHSLVLARPSYGEGSPKAWAHSPFKGGSPGAAHVFEPDPLGNVVINEFFANSDTQKDFIELYNHSPESVDVSGAFLSDSPTANRYRIPLNTAIPPGGFISFDEDALGFGLSSLGETIFFTNPANTRVIDAVRFGGTAGGVSTGRFPDGSPDWYELASPTPAAANVPLLIRDVVINEIMFNPISGDDRDEYIELYNKSGSAVDVGLWRFVDGISFEIPEGTSIPPGGFLVIAKDADHLKQKYPQLNESNTLGDYSGSLSNNGERIALATANDPTLPEEQWVVIDEVTYREGGRWGEWADGDGSSLELIDPRSDNRRASNWTHSDESAKSQWTTIERTGILEGGMLSPTELHILLLGAGQALVDDIEVIPASGEAWSANFDEGRPPRLLRQGNHVKSRLVDEGYESDRSLLIDATGGGDTGANRVEAKLNQSFNLGTEVTIRAKARWLAGHPDLLLRLQGNWLEAVGHLSVPDNLGTPGQMNSAFAANAGPEIFAVTHFPVLPAVGEDFVVTARVHDVDGVASVILKYNIDPDDTLYETEMRDDGTGGDSIADDGIYSATLAGRANRDTINFHIVALDANEAAAQTVFPENAPLNVASIKIGALVQESDFAAYRFWMSNDSLEEWETRENLSNQRIYGTFVYNDCRVVYGAGARFRGSPFIRSNFGSPVRNTGRLPSYVLTMPKDDEVLGAREFNLDCLEQGTNRDNTLQREKLSFWIADRMNLPFTYQRYVAVFMNGSRRGKVYTDSQQPDGDYFDSWYPGDGDGEVFKIDDWFEFNDDVPQSFNYSTARLQNYTRSGGEKNQARYRWSWEKQSNGGLNDDYSNLFDLVDALNEPGAEDYTRAVGALVDVEEWMKVFAVRHIVADWDGYGYQRGKNQFAYKTADLKWQMALWDLDISLGSSGDLSSNSPTHSMFDVEDPTISRFYFHPPFMRIYYQAMLEAVNGPLKAENINPVMDANYEAFQKNGIVVASPDDVKDWVAQRRNYLLDQLAPLNAAFAILTNGGQNFSVENNFLTLEGTASIEVKSITVGGLPYPVEWTGVNTWRIRLALAPGQNGIRLQPLDLWGKPIPRVNAQVTVTFNGQNDAPEGSLVINEIMYHPAGNDPEFIEIHNTSETTSFDLGGYRLNGADFTFPNGSIIQPGGYLVVTESQQAALKSYGAAVTVAGQFNGSLDNGGETLSLIKPGATPEEDIVIDSVRYDNDRPWPLAADGAGPSLQLIDPLQDNNRAGNWASGSPGTSENPQWTFISRTGTANSDKLVIHHSPYFPPPEGTEIEGVWSGEIRVDENNALAIQVDFTRDPRDQWSVILTVTDGGGQIPMDIVDIDPPDILFGFTAVIDPGLPPAQILWTGTHSPEEGTIAGIFSQPQTDQNGNIIGTFTAPFFLIKGLVNRPVREVFIDDLTLVKGDVAEAGENLVTGGDFEGTLADAWSIPDTHKDSQNSTEQHHSGESSLQLVSREGGEDLSTALWQEVPVEIGEVYTLSYWYLPAKTADQLSIHLEDGSIGLTHSAHPIQPFTPGAANDFLRELPAFPRVWINEVQPENENGFTDGFGEHDPWLELFNDGTSEADLQGFCLSDDSEDLLKWAFPEGASIGPGEFFVVWLDGQPEQTTADEWHASFSISPENGLLVLSRASEGSAIIIDYLNYEGVAPGHSAGLFPDGMHSEQRIFPVPTPGGENSFETLPATVFINEWMALNHSTIPDPADLQYEDWFELYNPSAQTVDLSGYTLTDNLANPAKFVIPQGWTIPARGYLLIWADDEFEQTQPGGSLHVNFKLSGDGEALGLFLPDGTLVDSVTFSQQDDDVSEGRLPDGGDLIVAMNTPTPGAANIANPGVIVIEPASVHVDSIGVIRFQFQTISGVDYRVLFKNDLTDPTWQLLVEIPGTGQMVTAEDVDAYLANQRFYLVEIVP